MAAAAAAMNPGSLVGARELRAFKRYLVLASRTITWSGISRLALVRDISRGGLFFYSNFEPAVGDNIEVVSSRGSRCSRIRGAVVRVEPHAPGAAVGIAIRLHAPRPKR